jgi:hypothetical protein
MGGVGAYSAQTAARVSDRHNSFRSLVVCLSEPAFGRTISREPATKELCESLTFFVGSAPLSLNGYYIFKLSEVRYLSILKRIASKLLPLYLRTSYAAWKIFAYQYGHLNTLKKLECRDALNEPIPWYAYPAIDFLNQLDLSEKTVFEFGSGFSTLYWSKKAVKVVSLEHDVLWFNKISENLPHNVKYFLETDKELYVSRIMDEKEFFDVIIIDGIERFRSAQNALQKLSPHGFIILDNADWYPRTARYLRMQGLKQIDFIGFSPINAYVLNTSFFINSTSALQRKETLNEPQELIGNIRKRAQDD